MAVGMRELIDVMAHFISLTERHRSQEANLGIQETSRGNASLEYLTRRVGNRPILSSLQTRLVDAGDDFCTERGWYGVGLGRLQ